MWTILEYQFPVRYQYPLAISESLENYGLSKLINFQDPTNKSDFGTYYARKVYDLAEKPISGCSQNFSFWSDIGYPSNLLVNFRGTKFAQLINIQDPIRKSDFDICQLILISIPQKLAGNKYYVWRFLECQFPVRYQLPLPFLKNSKGIEPHCHF